MAREDFELEDPGYDPSKFYVQATDKKGHSKNLRLHLLPEIVGRIESLIQAGTFPAYRTSGDFLRDAVYHRLYALEHRLHPFEVPDGLRMIAVEEEAIKLGRLLDQAESTVKIVEQTVGRLVQLGQEAAAKEIVGKALASLPDHPAARALYDRKLKTAFGQWIVEGAAE